MSGKRLYREYDDKCNLIKLECGSCREIKTVDNFDKCKSKKDGYHTLCKFCIKEYHSQYNKNNKEKINNHNNQYYQENKEKIVKQHRQYRENNKEYLRQYKEKNKEKILKYKRQYNENKLYKEMFKIYENVTKNLYPNNGIQYGIIYGVHCKVSDRWYIGQTTNSFDIRYHGDFFTYKFYGLSEENPKLELLHEDIEKYGKENFEIFEVIDVAFSEKELDEKECYYIDYYKAYDEGYNSNRGNILKHEKSKRKDVI